MQNLNMYVRKKSNKSSRFDIAKRFSFMTSSRVCMQKYVCTYICRYVEGFKSNAFNKVSLAEHTRLCTNIDIILYIYII